MSHPISKRLIPYFDPGAQTIVEAYLGLDAQWNAIFQVTPTHVPKYWLKWLKYVVEICGEYQAVTFMEEELVTFSTRVRLPKGYFRSPAMWVNTIFSDGTPGLVSWLERIGFRFREQNYCRIIHENNEALIRWLLVDKEKSQIFEACINEHGQPYMKECLDKMKYESCRYDTIVRKQ